MNEIDQATTDTPAANRSVDTPSTNRRIPRQRRRSPLLTSAPVRVALATSITCGLCFVAVSETRAASDDRDPPPAAVMDRAEAAEREAAEREHASRSRRRPIPSPSASVSPTPSVRPSHSPKPTKQTKPVRPAKPRPVAGLTQAQMDNAAVIVRVGRKLGVPRQGQIIAVATAMQESDLYNLASDALPESFDYPHQGSGADHDSVGLFQQRPSSGWGTVADLMRPAYAAEQFYAALLEIPDWAALSLTVAAQAVQVSAFPDAYARHEGRATEVVDALT